MTNVVRGTGALLLAALVGCRTEDPGNAGLQAQIDDMQLQIDDLQAQINAGATKDAEQDTRLDAHELSIEEIAGTDVGAVLTQVQDHEDAIGALETLTDTQGDDLDAMTADLADLETSVASVEADVSSIETNVTVLDTRLDGTETDISGLETSVASLGTRVTAAETTLGANTAAIAANGSAISALDIDIATLATEIASVETTNTSQDTSIATHTSEIATHTSEIATHTSDIAAIKTADAAQDTSIATHTSDIAAIKTADAGQDTSIAAIKSVNTSQDTTIAAHTTTLSSYGSRLGLLETDMTAVEGDASDALLENTMWRKTFSSEHGDEVANPVPNRTLTMTKVNAASALRITYFDNFRAIGNAGACRWEVLIDGNVCTAPGKLEHDHHTTGNVNIHFNSTIEGVCTATSAGTIGAGTHVVSVRITNMPGYGGDCYTGWNQGNFMGMIEVNEELP